MSGEVKIKKHKRYGKYMAVKVHPTALAQKNTSIHAGLNEYGVDFQPNTEVELPLEVVNMLKGAKGPVHKFDKSAESVNGNKGAHVTDWEPKYIVEVIKDQIEEVSEVVEPETPAS